MKDFPQNQIKYILNSKWDKYKELERTIYDFVYNHKRNISLTKTDDLILLYILGISNKAKKEFEIKFSSWQKTRDREATYYLTKLFFLSSISDKNRFKKEIILFLNQTSDNDVLLELKPLYFFLQDKYLDKNVNFENITNNTILSSIARLFICYDRNRIKGFYEMQIQLIDLIETQKLSVYEKIALMMFSEDTRFSGIQLNKKDSIEYLRVNNHSYFYKFVQLKFREIFFLEYKLWLIPITLIIFTVLRFFGLLTFLDSYTGEFFNIKIPSLIYILFSSYSLLLLFFCSIVIIIIFKLIIFFKRLREQ